MIDLRSDTATRPTKKMREIISNADVGDEQLGEDPSVNQLCDCVAALLGHEAAVFLPSGIMCNQVALSVHCSPGDEVLAAEDAHILQVEGGAVSANIGALVTPLSSKRGIFSPQALEIAIRPRKQRAPQPRVVCIEQTTNRGGGAIWQLSEFRDVVKTARSKGLSVHLDGARLMNAAVASDIPASVFASEADSVWIDLTKGLGCPIGAVLAGSRDFIQNAWFFKHRFGGAMRQAGLAAAAGLYALSYNVNRLKEDHQNAQMFARLICENQEITILNGKVETNIVLFELDLRKLDRRPEDLVHALEVNNVKIRSEGNGRYRVITHLDVNHNQVQQAARAIQSILLGWRKGTAL